MDDDDIGKQMQAFHHMRDLMEASMVGAVSKMRQMARK
jgi:hypothetical protein